MALIFRYCIGIFCLLIFSAVGTLATEQLDITKLVYGIEYQYHPKAPKEINLPKLTTQVNNRIMSENLDKDMKELYLTGNFKKVIPETIPSGNGLILRIHLYTNPKIASVNFYGNTIMKDHELMREIYSKPGTILNNNRLKTDIDRMAMLYHKKGYSLFRVFSATLDENNTLNFYFIEGRIAHVDITGLKKIKPFVVMRELASQEGNVFNESTLRRDRDRLVRLGYFSEVNAPELSESFDKSKVDLEFSVTERKTNRVDTGLEIDLRDDVLVTFIQGKVAHTLMHSDQLSGKVQLNLETGQTFSPRSYSVAYHQPYFLNRAPFSFTSTAWLRERRERISDATTRDLFFTERYGGDLSLGFPISRDLFQFNTRFRVENIRDVDDDIDVAPYSVQSVTGTLSFSTVQNVFNPKRAAYWTFSAESGDDLGLMQNQGLQFSRYEFNTAIFHPFFFNSTFAFRVFVGIFDNQSSTITTTFEEEIFEIGGPNSLRGYRINRAFVNERVTLFNFEIRKEIRRTMQWVLFYDIGRTFSDSFNLQFSEMNKGYGTGIRFFTPVGPIRFDLAFGETGDTILHFSLGQLF